MKDKTVLTIAFDKTNGDVNILVGNGLDLPQNAKAGDTATIRLGGGMSVPIIVQGFLLAFKQAKDMVMANPKLPKEDHLAMEQELYDLLNVSVGGYLDQGFPLVNAQACLTEEACVEYGLDPKSATAEQLLEAENRFIAEHPERAAQTKEMTLEKPKPYTGVEGGPNREQRRKAAKQNKNKA